MSNLKPTNDFVFKKLFGEKKNVDILKDLIQSILPELKIAKVVVNKDVSLERKLITDKLGILDVMATLNNNTKINIEMQVEDLHNTVERSIFYQSGVYHESLAKGVSYINAVKTIGIWITNYDVFKEGPFHEIARLKRDYENIILTDKYELHYIQLSKFKKKCKRISTKLEQLQLIHLLLLFLLILLIFLFLHLRLSILALFLLFLHIYYQPYLFPPYFH